MVMLELQQAHVLLLLVLGLQYGSQVNPGMAKAGRLTERGMAARELNDSFKCYRFINSPSTDMHVSRSFKASGLTTERRQLSSLKALFTPPC